MWVLTITTSIINILIIINNSLLEVVPVHEVHHSELGLLLVSDLILDLRDHPGLSLLHHEEDCLHGVDLQVDLHSVLEALREVILEDDIVHRAEEDHHDQCLVLLKVMVQAQQQVLQFPPLQFHLNLSQLSQLPTTNSPRSHSPQ